METKAERMTEAEKLWELSREFRKKRAKCSVWCPMWNSIDRDCELMGEQRLTPSTCRRFLECELKRREATRENEVEK